VASLQKKSLIVARIGHACIARSAVDIGCECRLAAGWFRRGALVDSRLADRARAPPARPLLHRRAVRAVSPTGRPARRQRAGLLALRRGHQPRALRAPGPRPSHMVRQPPRWCGNHPDTHTHAHTHTHTHTHRHVCVCIAAVHATFERERRDNGETRGDGAWQVHMDGGAGSFPPVPAPGAAAVAADSGAEGCRESYQLARGSSWTESLCETIPETLPVGGPRSWSLAGPPCAPDERQHCLGMRALSDTSVFFCTGQSRTPQSQSRTSVFLSPSPPGLYGANKTQVCMLHAPNKTQVCNCVLRARACAFNGALQNGHWNVLGACLLQCVAPKVPCVLQSIGHNVLLCLEP